jgi:hypothetical protein
LALVYELRGMSLGAPLKIRELDLDVLAHALTLRSRDVRTRLHMLMSGDRESLEGNRRWLRGRLVVPVVGTLVAVTAVGGLLFERAQDDGIPSTPPTTSIGSATVASVDIGDPAVLVRPSGS